MIGVLDLPVELLIRIVQLLGWELKVYSDKERQTDLTRLAHVNRAFKLIADTLLYGGTVNVSSAGRTFLLACTLKTNETLAALVHTLVAKSVIDNGHPASLLQILQLTHLTSATLASVFFTKNQASFEMYSALQAQRRLESFAYGFHGVDTPLAPITPLLQSWPGLTSLTLDRVAPFDRGLDSLKRHAEVRGWGSPPSYKLKSLEISNCRSIDTVGWPLKAFKWLLGATDGLTSLTLVGFDAAFDLRELFALLAEQGCTSSLERLNIRNFSGDADLDLDEPRFDPSSLSTLFPSLSFISLANDDGETCFLPPKPFLHLPPSVRILELHEDLFLDWHVLRTVEEGPPASFRKIKLVGPFPTDPDVRALRTACEERGLLLEVERTF
ncbi:hypothetical protein JCM10213_000523 [Rhodosporidiobolus nylandii]